MLRAGLWQVPWICTNRTHKLFFPPAYTELAKCSMMTTSLSGPQLHVRRRRSPATQPTCLKRQQLELHCGLQYPVTAQEWHKQHMTRPQCVLHSHSTSQLGFVCQRAFLLCYVSFGTNQNNLVPKIFLKYSGVRKLLSAIGSLYLSIAVRRTVGFRIEYFVALLQPNS